MPFCGNCGKELAEDDKLCGSCGAIISDSEGAPVSSSIGDANPPLFSSPTPPVVSPPPPPMVSSPPPPPVFTQPAPPPPPQVPLPPVKPAGLTNYNILGIAIACVIVIIIVFLAIQSLTPQLDTSQTPSGAYNGANPYSNPTYSSSGIYQGYAGGSSGTPFPGTTSTSHRSPTSPTVSSPVLEADFTVSPTTGTAPLTVKFIDKSIGFPTGWSWTFGDGGVSSLRNPTHTFIIPGSFVVTLNVVGNGQSNSKKAIIDVYQQASASTISQTTVPTSPTPFPTITITHSQIPTTASSSKCTHYTTTVNGRTVSGTCCGVLTQSTCNGVPLSQEQYL